MVLCWGPGASTGEYSEWSDGGFQRAIRCSALLTRWNWSMRTPTKNRQANDTAREKQMLWQYSSNRADRFPRKVQFGNWRWLGWGYHSEVVQQMDPLNVSEKSRRIRRLVETMMAMRMRTMATWNKKPTKTKSINDQTVKQNTMKRGCWYQRLEKEVCWSKVSQSVVINSSTAIRAGGDAERNRG